WISQATNAPPYRPSVVNRWSTHVRGRVAMTADIAWETVPQLAGQYPRVLSEIVRRWQTAELDEYFSDLFFPTRPGRQGFPPAVMQDIFNLFKLHEEWKARGGRPLPDVWSGEKVPHRIADNEERIRARRLFQALEDGNDAALRAILDEGINLELTNGSGWTPLMVAAFMGRERQAALLIEAGARINSRDRRGYCPLHWAAVRGYDSVVELLLRRGARANQRSDKGITPLLQAASLGHCNIVRRLLKQGASVNERDDEGWTPLHKAVANDHRET